MSEKLQIGAESATLDSTLLECKAAFVGGWRRPYMLLLYEHLTHSEVSSIIQD